jgi:hypothetical protein
VTQCKAAAMVAESLSFVLNILNVLASREGLRKY